MMSELVKIRERMLECLKSAKWWTPFAVSNVISPSYEHLDEVLTAGINRTLGVFLKAPIENFPPPLAPKLLSPKTPGSLHDSRIVFFHLFKEHSFPSFLLSNMALEDNPQELTQRGSQFHCLRCPYASWPRTPSLVDEEYALPFPILETSFSTLHMPNAPLFWGQKNHHLLGEIHTDPSIRRSPANNNHPLIRYPSTLSPRGPHSENIFLVH